MAIPMVSRLTGVLVRQGSSHTPGAAAGLAGGAGNTLAQASRDPRAFRLERPAVRLAPVGLVAALVLVALTGGPRAALGEQFRVENRIYDGNAKQPRFHSTTIFLDDVVYDYLDEPVEVTVLDRGRGRFVLLDMSRRVRTELTTSELEELAQRLKTWAMRQGDDYLSFQATPQFTETFDETSGQLRLESPWTDYRLETAPAQNKALMHYYREFCDRYAMLNTQLNPGARLPFPRMAVNEALERLGRFPLEVHLTVRPKGNGLLAEKQIARSQHQLIPHLLQSDRDRIAQTDQFMAIFQPVSFRQYQKRIQDER